MGWRKESTIVCGFQCLQSSVLSIQPYPCHGGDGPVFKLSC